MDQPAWWRPAAAEFLGVMALVFVGAGSIVGLARANLMAGAGQELIITIGAALAHGLAIAVMVLALGHISGGHFNPAVTIAAIFARRISMPLGAVYIVFQLLGGLVAAALLVTALPSDWWRAVDLGTPVVNAAVDPAKAVLIEAVLTFFLTIVIFGIGMDHRNGSRAVAGLAIGLTVTMCILMAAGLTGAAFNPARAFSTALLANSWKLHYVYWVGPIVGAVVGGLVYDLAFVEARVKPSPIPPAGAPEPAVEAAPEPPMAPPS